MRHVAAALLLTTLAAAAGCTSTSLPGTSASQPPLGAYCTVQFHRTLLGGAGEVHPIPPTTDSIGGAAVSVAGRLLKLDREWLVLAQDDNRELWIPRPNILLLKISRN